MDNGYIVRFMRSDDLPDEEYSHPVSYTHLGSQRIPDLAAGRRHRPDSGPPRSTTGRSG